LFDVDFVVGGGGDDYDYEGIDRVKVNFVFVSFHGEKD
jgi:hypothetical protein